MIKLEITKKRLDNGAFLIGLEGQLNVITVSDLKDILRELGSEENEHVILDLENLSFIDSSGLSALISALKNSREKKGFLKIVGLQPAVRKVFELTMLDRVFDIRNSLEDALKD
jgi:anti-sigma B factor antagonist